MKKMWWLLFVVFLLSLGVVNAYEEVCTFDDECLQGVCEDNLCVAECETDEDCVEPEICEEIIGICEIGVVSCSDTDASATDPNKVKGTRTLFYSDGSDSESTDSCFSTRDIRQGLNEYWCVDGDWGGDSIDCVATYGSGYVCSDGACTNKLIKKLISKKNLFARVPGEEGSSLIWPWILVAVLVAVGLGYWFWKRKK